MDDSLNPTSLSSSVTNEGEGGASEEAPETPLADDVKVVEVEDEKDEEELEGDEGDEDGDRDEDVDGDEQEEAMVKPSKHKKSSKKNSLSSQKTKEEDTHKNDGDREEDEKKSKKKEKKKHHKKHHKERVALDETLEYVVVHALTGKLLRPARFGEVIACSYEHQTLRRSLWVLKGSSPSEPPQLVSTYLPQAITHKSDTPLPPPPANSTTSPTSTTLTGPTVFNLRSSSSNPYLVTLYELMPKGKEESEKKKKKNKKKREKEEKIEEKSLKVDEELGALGGLDASPVYASSVGSEEKWYMVPAHVFVKPQRWMEVLQPHISQIPLLYLALPGTHDSCTSHIKANSPASPDTPVLDKFRAFSFATGPIVSRWSRCQSTDAAEQLHDGIRYLDLRVARSKGKFYLAHGLLGPSMEEVLSQIEEFISVNSKEVVILDFNHFYGLSEGDHHTLCQMITSTLGSGLIAPSEKFDSFSTLGSLLKAKLNYVIIYHHDIVLDTNEVSYPFWFGNDSIHAPWINTTVPAILESQLQRNLAERQPRGKIYVSQAQLTPTGKTVSSSLFSFRKVPRNLNSLSTTVNPTTYAWLRAGLSDSQLLHLNVVIMDYYQPKLTYLTIVANLRKAHLTDKLSRLAQQCQKTLSSKVPSIPQHSCISLFLYCVLITAGPERVTSPGT
eukprot:TRINITY_DN1889_c0_g1_i1.p1 TRINITY_DN1889_c0_g1~~TRINITY_DN1889_c0_g1_i1.p1  ORF type:complete len:671 (-),score=148.61 TRINITY_DN1889_c0_g1_i1:283-2295(-)